MVSVIYEYTISMRTVLSGTNPNASPKESLVRLAAERAAKHDAGGRRSGSDDQQLRKRRHRAHQDNEGKGSQR